MSLAEGEAANLVGNSIIAAGNDPLAQKSVQVVKMYF
jgi:hypothetical protein